MPSQAIINTLKNIKAFPELYEKLASSDRFDIYQRDETEAKKALATKFAINELRVNNFSNSEVDFKEVYHIVWLEKLMFVEMSFTVNEINKRAKLLLSNQKEMIASIGLIVSRTGEILENQTIIISELGEIKVISQQTLDNTFIIIEKTDEVLEHLEDFKANGVKIDDRRKESGNNGYGKDNTLMYVGIGVITLVALVVIIKTTKK